MSRKEKEKSHCSSPKQYFPAYRLSYRPRIRICCRNRTVSVGGGNGVLRRRLLLGVAVSHIIETENNSTITFFSPPSSRNAFPSSAATYAAATTKDRGAFLLLPWPVSSWETLLLSLLLRGDGQTDSRKGEEDTLHGGSFFFPPCFLLSDSLLLHSLSALFSSPLLTSAEKTFLLQLNTGGCFKEGKLFAKIWRIFLLFFPSHTTGCVFLRPLASLNCGYADETTFAANSAVILACNVVPSFSKRPSPSLPSSDNLCDNNFLCVARKENWANVPSSFFRAELFCACSR